MATYAIGDIHGCWDALETLIERVPFGDDVLLITLGDYVDRGPDSARVLDWVMQLHGQGRCLPLRGNHELMMQAVIDGQVKEDHWLACGGLETLQSYSPSSQKRNPRLEDIPHSHSQFLKEKLLPYYETDSHIFVHASVFEGYSMQDQDEHTLYWDRFEYIQPHQSGKIVVCGHTAQKSGRPVHRGHAICIDTWVYGKGWLTCLDLESGQYWQANQKRQHRTHWLEAPE